MGLCLLLAHLKENTTLSRISGTWMFGKCCLLVDTPSKSDPTAPDEEPKSQNNSSADEQQQVVWASFLQDDVYKSDPDQQLLELRR